MYESFYLRAFSPREQEPVALWIRYTAHKRPGARARGSIWCTVFDARRGAPFMHKLTSDRLTVPADGWIAIEDATMGPLGADGVCGPATWALRYRSQEPELRHLSPPALYRTPLPRTKLTTPLPGASFEGTLQLGDDRRIELDGWPGMVGHNWGSEHAERWIWLHCAGLQEEPRAWLDVAMGRIRIAGRTTPWSASGALCLDGVRHRVGGLTARVEHVAETPRGCVARLRGPGGLKVSASVEVPADGTAGWRYSDPDGGEHDVLNCSVAAAELTVATSSSSPARTLRTAHGAAYELGMRERDHGVEIAPFADG
jgi:hypothetical protein